MAASQAPPVGRKLLKNTKLSSTGEKGNIKIQNIKTRSFA